MKRKRPVPNRYGLSTNIDWLSPHSNHIAGGLSNHSVNRSAKFLSPSANPFLVSSGSSPFSFMSSKKKQKYPLQQNQGAKFLSPSANPFLIQKAKGKKNLRWTQALMNSKYPSKLNPLGDADKDGVLNMFDCRPFDKRRQEDRQFRIKTKGGRVITATIEGKNKKKIRGKKNIDRAELDLLLKAMQERDADKKKMAMEKVRTRIAAAGIIKREKRKEQMFGFIPGEAERAMKTMEEDTKMGQLAKARELAERQMFQKADIKRAERIYRRERKEYAKLAAPRMIREGAAAEQLEKGMKPTFGKYGKYTKAEIARSKRMGGAPEALAGGVTKTVAVTAKALKPVYAAAEYAREVPLARLKERGHLAFERKNVQKGKVYASRIRGALGAITSLGGFEQLAEGGVSYTPGGEGSGRGRGRPRGSITPKYLPGVGMVQMPVFAYRKALSDIKQKAKVQAAMQQAAAEVAMARQQGRNPGQQLMDNIPDSSQGSQGSQVGAGMEETSPSATSAGTGMMEDNFDQMAADEAALMRPPQQEQMGDLVAPPQMSQMQMQQMQQQMIQQQSRMPGQSPGTDRPFRQRTATDAQANPYGLKSRFRINFGDSHIARADQNSPMQSGQRSSILNAPPIVTGEANPAWSKRRNMNQVFAGEGGAPDGTV